MPSRASNGFTLIELLAALFIMALLALAGYRGLNTVLQAREAVAQETRKWQQLMFFFSRMELDVAQALRRPVRDQAGNIQPEWLGLNIVAGYNEAQLMFTRAGMVEEGEAKMVPQRIGYRHEQDTVQLLRWPSLDQPPNSVPRRDLLLSGVREFDLRYMTTTGSWFGQWPPDGKQAYGLPSALEVGLTLSGGEKVTRVFALQ